VSRPLPWADKKGKHAQSERRYMGERIRRNRATAVSDKKPITGGTTGRGGPDGGKLS